MIFSIFKNSKREKKRMCEYENCKNAKKPNEDFCGRHIKKGNKLRFPEKYCKKKNCTGLKL